MLFFFENDLDLANVMKAAIAPLIQCKFVDSLTNSFAPTTLMDDAQKIHFVDRYTWFYRKKVLLKLAERQIL